MPTPRILLDHVRAGSRPSGQDLRPGLDALPPETRRILRTVGTLLAVGSLAIAFAAAAQTSAYGPRTESGGLLAWVFALLVGLAVLAVFLVVLNLVRAPTRRPGDLPGSARRR